MAACEVHVWKRLLFVSYVPAALAGLILTASRGGVMALLGAVVAFGLCAAHRGRVRLLLGVLVCYAIAYALPPHTMSRFMTIAEELQHGGTLSGRRIFWERAAALVAEHPLRGLGAGTGEAVLWLGSHNAVS